MKRIIIGSSALKHHFPDFPREPKDLDYATLTEEKSNTPTVEYLYNPILFKYEDNTICGLDNLLTLKISHLFWETGFDKHLWDVLYLLDKGCEIKYDLLDELMSFWEDYLPKIKRSNLVMTKEDFFTNSVNEDTDEHDYLHTLLNPIPMYTKLLKDGSEVELDENKWVLLTHEEKNLVIWEETSVMAYERYPNLCYKKAFLRQLKANIMKHFPRYISLHAIKNFREIHITKINYNLKLKENGIKRD